MDAASAGQRLRELAEVRLRGIEEQDVGDDATRIHIDNQVPEHEHHDPPEIRRRKQHPEHPYRQYVDTTPLTDHAAAQEPTNVAAAAYQHTVEKTPTHKLDVEG